MAKLFGTDGIRGEAGTFPLDASTVFTIGASLASRMRGRLGRDVRFVTGRDTRESGGWIERELIGGAVLAGAECTSAGVMTTPGVAFITRAFKFDLGIVISSSHNPFYDNGIKAFLPSGKKIEEELETEVEADIASNSNGAAEDPEFKVDDERAAEYRRAYLQHLSRATAEFRLD